MDQLQATSRLSQDFNYSLNQCLWMQAGVIDYKLCDHDYDCEHCPFDDCLHGRSFPLRSNSSIETIGVREHATESNRERIVCGLKIIGSRFYHPSHLWARIEADGIVRVGLDDLARRILGRVYSVNLPNPGESVERDRACWQVFHKRGRSAFTTPVSGRVAAINQKLKLQPTLLNRDVYGEGWVFLVEPSDLKGSLKRLLFGESMMNWYEQEIELLLSRLAVLPETEYGLKLTQLNKENVNAEFFNKLSAEQMQVLADAFFKAPPANEEQLDNAIFR